MTAPPERESVWDFPRPPRVEPTPRHIEVVFAGVVVADTRRALRLLETSHPPTYYLPLADVRRDLLRPSRRGSFCEWKGQAEYFHLAVGDRLAADVAWFYPAPTPAYAALADHVAFYPGPMDGCFVDGERVTPQPGGFYGGWITADLVGPFKGGPGSAGW